MPAYAVSAKKSKRTKASGQVDTNPETPYTLEVLQQSEVFDMFNRLSNTFWRRATLIAGTVFFVIANGGVLLADGEVPTSSLLTGIVHVSIAASNCSTWAYSAIFVSSGRKRWFDAFIAACSGMVTLVTLFYVIVPALFN